MLALARKEADRLNSPLVGAEHVLLGILVVGSDATAGRLLITGGITLEDARLEVQKQVGIGSVEQKGNIPYTADVKELLTLGAKESERRNHHFVGTEHILFGILSLSDAVVTKVLKNLNADAEQLRRSLFKKSDDSEQLTVPKSGNSVEENVTEDTREILYLARQEAKQFNHNFVGTEHILLAIVSLKSCKAARVLLKLGLHLESVREEVEKQIGKGPEESLAGRIPLTPRVQKVFRLALREAKKFNETEVDTDHLLLGLMIEGDGVAARVLTNLDAGINLIRETVLELRGEDPAIPENNQSKSQETSSGRSAIYQKTYSAFVPDRSVYGHHIPNAPIDDALGLAVHAGHLAQLIAAKDTWMPLSIGLFGAWGSGKSHFIDLLDERLRSITKEPTKVFHRQIVQIRFNAWHYLDTNLWANLVCEIFEQLFAKLSARGDTVDQVKKLKEKLAAQSVLAAEAKAALETAEKRREEAEKDLHAAIKNRTEQEKTVGTLLNDLSNLAITDDVKQQLANAADALGLPDLKNSYVELETRAAEIQPLAGRIKAIILTSLIGPGIWRRWFLLAVALAVPLGVSWFAAHGNTFVQNLLSGAGKIIAQIVTFISALSAWLGIQIKTGKKCVSNFEDAYKKIKQVRKDRESKDDAAEAQRNLRIKRQAEEEARQRLHEAEEKMKSLKSELAELAPGRQLIRFLKERATTEDYRRHLGLVSLIRRDFEQLSSLLVKAGEERDSSLPQIDRIVLYIDDLDRCKASRVVEVLEAVHLLLAFPLFAVVVAVDPRWLRQSLLDHYPNLLGIGENGQLRNLGQLATPQDYLEKIFQVPFNLQPMEKIGFKALVDRLFPVEKSSSSNEKGIAPDASWDMITADEATLPADQPQIASRKNDSDPAGPSIQEAPDPQRLLLTPKEAADVQRFQPLFETPRSVKRFANTYCLIRVGVSERDWAGYIGENEVPGKYRNPMLLLAVASAFPSLSRTWLRWLLEASPKRWGLSDNDITELLKLEGASGNRSDWERLAQAIEKTLLVDWPIPNSESLNEWVPRAALYSF